jgi:hypothetical protein
MSWKNSFHCMTQKYQNFRCWVRRTGIFGYNWRLYKLHFPEKIQYSIGMRSNQFQTIQTIKNILIKIIWFSIIFIWCAHKLNIRDFFFQNLQHVQLFSIFQDLDCLNWVDLIPILKWISLNEESFFFWEKTIFWLLNGFYPIKKIMYLSFWQGSPAGIIIRAPGSCRRQA